MLASFQPLRILRLDGAPRLDQVGSSALGQPQSLLCHLLALTVFAGQQMSQLQHIEPSKQCEYRKHVVN